MKKVIRWSQNHYVCGEECVIISKLQGSYIACGWMCEFRRIQNLKIRDDYVQKSQNVFQRRYFISFMINFSYIS